MENVIIPSQLQDVRASRNCLPPLVKVRADHSHAGTPQQIQKPRCRSGSEDETSRAPSQAGRRTIQYARLPNLHLHLSDIGKLKAK